MKLHDGRSRRRCYGRHADRRPPGGALAGNASQEDFFSDEALHVAVTHYIQIVGEAARRVSGPRRDSIPQLPWEKIVGMRHRLVHDYFNVRLPIVWSALNDVLPNLIQALEAILPREEN